MNWDKAWQKEIADDYWKIPDTDVEKFFDGITVSGYPRVLDYGCGIGRHSIMCAKKGHDVTAIDLSGNAVEALRDWAKRENLDIETRIADLSDPYFDDRIFDAILCCNAIYHCMRSEIVEKLRRILHNLGQGGFLYLTMPTREDGKYGYGEQVEPHTYLCEKSVHAGDIHYFADEKDLMELLRGFTVYSLKRDEHYWDNNGERQFSSYWKVACKSA